MDSFRKKVVPRQQPPKPPSQANYARLNQNAFRQIQQQFSKNRTNNEKVMESLERINASSLEKSMKSERVRTEESFQQSSIEMISSPASQLHEASFVVKNNEERSKGAIKPTRPKIVSQLALSDVQQIPGWKTTARQDRRSFVDGNAIQMTQPDQELAEIRNNIHQQYKKKLYDHDVYIKELLRETTELNEEWGKSRQQLYQARLEKEAVEREMRKDREEYGLLKEVLIKENQYYKCELRICQREATQLRDRLNKLAGLKGAADQMEQISENEHIQEEEQVVEKLQQLQKTVKDYAERLYMAKQYELELEEITKQNQAIRVELQQLKDEHEALMLRMQREQTERTTSVASLQNELTQESSKLAEINGQLQQKTHRLAQTQWRLVSYVLKAKKHDDVVASLTEQTRQESAARGLLTEQLTQRQSTILQFQKQLANAQINVKALQKEVSLAEQSKAQRQLVEQQNAASQQQITSLKDRIEQLEIDVQTLTDKLNAAETASSVHIPVVSSNDGHSQTIRHTQRWKCVRTVFQSVEPVAPTVLQKIFIQSATLTEQADGLEPHPAQQELEQKEQQLATLRRESQHTQQQLQLTTEELNNVRSLANSLQTKELQLLKQLQTCAVSKDESDELMEKQVKQLLRKIESLEEENERAAYNKDSAERKYDAISEEFEKFRGEYDSLIQAHECLEAQSLKMQANLTEKDHDIERLTEELSKMQERIEELNGLQNRQCQECRRLEREVNRMDAELRSTRYDYEDRIIKMGDENEDLKNTVTRIRAFSKETF